MQKRMIEDDDWVKLTRRQYNGYIYLGLKNKPTELSSSLSANASFPSQLMGGLNTSGDSRIASAHPSRASYVSLSPAQQELNTLKRTIKVDASHYQKLTDHKYIDSFWRSFSATAKFQGMGHILDPTFTPSADPTEKSFLTIRTIICTQ